MVSSLAWRCRVVRLTGASNMLSFMLLVIMERDEKGKSYGFWPLEEKSPPFLLPPSPPNYQIGVADFFCMMKMLICIFHDFSKLCQLLPLVWMSHIFCACTCIIKWGAGEPEFYSTFSWAATGFHIYHLLRTNFCFLLSCWHTQAMRHYHCWGCGNSKGSIEDTSWQPKWKNVIWTNGGWLFQLEQIKQFCRNQHNQQKV